LAKPRTIFLTGATGVIGTQLVRHFVEAGDTVIAAAYVDAPGASTFEELAEGLNPERFFTLPLNLENETAVDEALAFLDRERLRPTCLVNGARNVDHLKLTDQHMPTREGWLGEFRLDIVVSYELTMALANQADSKLDSVVSLSSMYGLVAPTPALYDDFEEQSPIHYGVVKAAQIHLSKELAVRLAGRGIRVNSVSFGGVVGRVDDEFLKRYAKLCPMGRMLKKEEVVGAIDFMLSDAASSITGHNLVVDGGWTVW
jgi:NAD(P)-dependent dehydrogenase (short-subunit alcohol dehydrogenase family)